MILTRTVSAASASSAASAASCAARRALSTAVASKAAASKAVAASSHAAMASCRAFPAAAATVFGAASAFASPMFVVRRGYASSDFPAHTILRMPALSPTMTHGNIGQWHKKVGDEISPGDVLVEIETDKAQMDFECQEEGFLAKPLIAPGQKDVPVNTPLAILVENKADADKFANYVVDASDVAGGASDAPAAAAPAAAAAASSAAAPAATAAAPVSEGRVFASPIAKALAAERGISLNAIKGTGPGGRIVKEDVDNYKPAAAAAAAAAAPAARAAAPAKPSPVAAPAVPAPGASFTDIPLTNVRKVISSRLSESKSTIPHFYLTVDINADKLLKLREVLNKEGNGKFKLSVNDFVIKASSLALKDVPEVNSAWQDTFIRQFHTADIAVAVATENGLITPIVHSAEGKGLSTISNSVKELAEKARAGKLAPHEYQGGTFTISNLGMFGIQHFTAIINPPHAAILAVGGLEDKLVIDESAPRGFRAQKTMHVTLSNDHRVVDGAVGAKWLQRFKAYLENPLTMLL